MRKLVCISLGFGSACALAAYLNPNDFWVYGLIFFGLSVGTFIASKYGKLLRVVAFILVGLTLGTFWFCAYDALYLNSPRDLDGKSLLTTFTLSDYCKDSKYGISTMGEFYHEGRTYRVLIFLNNSAAHKPGDQITGYFRFRFTSLGGEKEPNYRQGDGVFLFASQIGRYTLDKCQKIPIRYYGAHLRHVIGQRIDELFPDDAAAFSKALLLGDRSDLDYETTTNFKLSGISHIVAVSGLHVSIVYAFVYLLSGRRRWLLLLLGIPSLLLFSSIAGFTPSVTRACIMQGMMILAMVCNREYDPPTALGLSVLIMLALNPMVITSVSFQLSVCCMIGIFLFYNRIHGWLLNQRIMGSVKGKGIVPRLKRGVAASVSISLSATILTTPLVAYYFGAVSLVGVLTNAAAVWMVAYIFYGVAVTCAFSLIGGVLVNAISWVTIVSIRILLEISGFFADFPFAAVYTKSVYVVLWLIFAYAMIAVFLLMRKKRALLLGGLLTVCLCVALLLSWIEPLLDGCRVTVLDVGQGQSILIQSDGKSFLVDCGGYSETASADVAAEMLLSQGIHHLDGVIVTHYDDDHAGGVLNLLTRISADRVYLPNIADHNGLGKKIRDQAGDNVVLVEEDISLSYLSSNLQIFGPETYELGNESSLCVLFRRENCDILITGDRGELGENLLMQRTTLPKLDLLIAGHHGSGGSTSDRLLAATEPEYVFISVGENNRYGHPSDELLQRLEEHGCLIVRTDLNGTIVYRG